MIVLNVYGSPSSPRYNAVWVKRPGTAYLAFHGVRDADYQRRFDQAVASGHAPVLVSATGSGASAVFAALFEQGIPGPWLARHGLNRAAFESANTTAIQGGMALRSMAVYGSGGDPRYAGVWHSRPAGVVTHLRALNDTASYQAVFDAETSLPFFRPRFVSVAEDRHLAAVFSNDIVGRWAARHGLTAGQYQREFDRNLADGFSPICVSAGGIGASALCGDLRRAGHRLRQGRPGNQVVPEDDGLGLSTLRPADNVQVPAVFGGDQMRKESAFGSCGLASSATALALFIRGHAVWGMGGRTVSRRYGSTPGARSAAVSRADGVDWVLIFNTRMGIGDDEWNTLVDEIESSLDGWPARRRRRSAKAKGVRR